MSTTQTYHDTYEHDWFDVSIAGVPSDSCQELHGHLTTAYHSNAFSTSREGQQCGGFANKHTIRKVRKGLKEGLDISRTSTDSQ